MNLRTTTWIFQCAAFALILACAAHAQRDCSVVNPFPRLPVQATQMLPAVAAMDNSKGAQIVMLTGMTPPRDRFLVIDNIAIKGTHPAKSYMALELRTTVTVSPPARLTWSVGPVAPQQQVWTRHFLYERGSHDDSSALNLRFPLNIYSAPGMPVYLGVQTAAGIGLEQMDITVTGYWVDACKWGQ